MDDLGLALDRQRDQLMEPDFGAAPQPEPEATPAERQATTARSREEADQILQPSWTAEPQVDVLNAPAPADTASAVAQGAPEKAAPEPGQAVQTAQPAQTETAHAITQPPEAAVDEEGDATKVQSVLAEATREPAAQATGAPPAATQATGAAPQASPQTASPEQPVASTQAGPQQLASPTQATPAEPVAAQPGSSQPQAATATPHKTAAAHTAAPEAAAQHAAPAKSNVPTGDTPWTRFVYAIGMNESGWRHGDMKNGAEVIGAGTTGTSGMDASYGRFQTTAGSAVDVLKKYPEVAKQFGFTNAELKELSARVESVQGWWNLIMKGKVGQGFTAEDVQLAQQRDPAPFKAKWGAKWTQSTGMGVDDLDRMLATVQFKAVIEHFAPPGHKIKDKKERKQVAEKIFNSNPELFARLGGMQAKDLTGFLKTNMMLENLAGFQMKAAGGEGGHLFRAINQNAGLDFGLSELKSVRDAVEAKGKKLGVAIKSEQHLYMLCARAHNKGMGTLSKTNYEDPNSLLGDDYVVKMLATYRGATDAQLASMGNVGANKAGDSGHAPADPATTAASTASHPQAKSTNGAAPAKPAATPAASFPDVKPTHAFASKSAKPAVKKELTFELYKKEAMSLVARVYNHQLTPRQALAEFASFAKVEEGGVSLMAAGVTALLKQLLPADHGTPTAAQPRAAGAQEVHASGSQMALPKPSAAFHDGSKDKALGEGDEVFNASGEVLTVFPPTPEGVVAAAFYELHRGSKQSLAEIMADKTGKKTERGELAAKEARGAHGGTNDDREGSQVIGHVSGKGKRIAENGALGPIEAYVHSVGQDAGIPWCGSFATFCYLRAGIKTGSLAYSLDVPNKLAHSGKDGQVGAYYHMTGTEGSARIKGQKGKAYGGELEAGEHVSGKGGQRYHGMKLQSAMDLDVRAGDVFWQEHSASSGHVGIIVGVYKTKSEVTLVTVEGNASDQVMSRTHKITVGENGQVTSGVKGWGRPAELGGFAPPAAGGDEPEWIAQAEEQQRHHGKITDR